MSLKAIRDGAAIVGVGTTAFGRRYRQLDPELTPYELAVEALTNALDDAGLEGSGRMPGVALQTAVMAVTTGMAEVVACVYGNNGRSTGARYGGEEGGQSTAIYDTMYGMTSPGAYVAMMFRRYQYLYGAPDDGLAPLAINNRNNGALNPNAVMQKPSHMTSTWRRALSPNRCNCWTITSSKTEGSRSLEGFGFCPRGGAWQWVKDGRIELAGELPVNTSGGHTAESYMQGWALHVEAVRQLRGEAGDRQVPNCEVAQYICGAPIVTSHILRK